MQAVVRRNSCVKKEISYLRVKPLYVQLCILPLS